MSVEWRNSVTHLFSFSLTHSSIHSFMRVFPYSFQKHALLASDLSPDLGLPLSRVAFGVWGCGWDMTAEFQTRIHDLDESEALQGRKEDSRRLEGWGGT